VLIHLALREIVYHRKRGKSAAVADQVRHFAQELKPAAEERHQATFVPAPQCFAGQDGQVARHGAGEVPARRVPPKHPLLVPRLLLQQVPPRLAVRRRDAVIDARMWLEQDAVAGPVEAERHVHVFKISAERFRKCPDAEQGFAAVEGA
jgi:hypothetical protein